MLSLEGYERIGEDVVTTIQEFIISWGNRPKTCTDRRHQEANDPGFTAVTGRAAGPAPREHKGTAGAGLTRRAAAGTVGHRRQGGAQARVRTLPEGAY